MPRPDKHVLAIRCPSLNGWDGSASASGIAGDDRACANLEVNVLFTETRGTLAALRAAAELAWDLHGSIRLLAPQEVPFGFPLDHPPVSVKFTRQRLADLASQAVPEALEATVHLYLCRSKLDALGRILEPNSLVVVGGKRWWPNDASWTAKMLRSAGHQVIFVSSERVGSAGKRAAVAQSGVRSQTRS